jgi:hypothetical protein
VRIIRVGGVFCDELFFTTVTKLPMYISRFSRADLKVNGADNWYEEQLCK